MNLVLIACAKLDCHRGTTWTGCLKIIYIQLQEVTFRVLPFSYLINNTNILKDIKKLASQLWSNFVNTIFLNEVAAVCNKFLELNARCSHSRSWWQKMVVLSSIEIVVEVKEVAVIPLLFLVPTVGLVCTVVVIMLEEIMRWW